MAKLSVFSAVFAALIAISAATTYTTTVVTTEINRPDEQSCQAEIQRVRINPCVQHVARELGMERERAEYEPSFLRSDVANPRQQQEEEQLKECCEQLRSVSPTCRGDAVRRVMREMSEKFGPEMQKTRDDRVRSLTQKCNLRKSSPYMI